MRRLGKPPQREPCCFLSAEYSNNDEMAKDYLKRELGQAFTKSSQVIALFSSRLGDNQFIINRCCGSKFAPQRIILMNFGAESSRPASLLCTLRTHQSPGEWQHSLPACSLALAERDFHPLDFFRWFPPPSLLVPPPPRFSQRDRNFTAVSSRNRFLHAKKYGLHRPRARQNAVTVCPLRACSEISLRHFVRAFFPRLVMSQPCTATRSFTRWGSLNAHDITAVGSFSLSVVRLETISSATRWSSLRWGPHQPARRAVHRANGLSAKVCLAQEGQLDATSGWPRLGVAEQPALSKSNPRCKSILGQSNGRRRGNP